MISRQHLLVGSALSALCAACGGEPGRIHIYLAGPALTNDPAHTLTIDGCSFGEALHPVGDVDADGRDDFLINRYESHSGGAAIGSATGIRHIELSRSLSETIYSIGAAGDTDGDGRADLVVAGSGGVRIFRRGLPPDGAADVELVPDAPTFVDVTSVGDVNRDGFTDVAAVWQAEGRTDIYLGGTAMDSVVDVPLSGSSGLVAAAGDFNGDGFADVLVGATVEGAVSGAPGSKIAEIYWGGLSMDAAPDLALLRPEASPPPRYAFAGDLNGDGETDLVVDGIRTVNVYFGGPGADGRADLVLEGTAAAVGDLDGDGVSDLALSVPWSPEGRVRVFLGGPALDDVADSELGDRDGFGSSLAYVRNFDEGPALAIVEPGTCLY